MLGQFFLFLLSFFFRVCMVEKATYLHPVKTAGVSGCGAAPRIGLSSLADFTSLLSAISLPSFAPDELDKPAVAQFPFLEGVAGAGDDYELLVVCLADGGD